MRFAQGVLRSARPADLDRLVAFYAQDTSSFLIPRPHQELLDAASSGLVFIVERDKTIVAASGVFSYGVANAVVELSDSLVTAPVAGVGLQTFFLHLRVAHVIVLSRWRRNKTRNFVPMTRRIVSMTTRVAFARRRLYRVTRRVSGAEG